MLHQGNILKTAEMMAQELVRQATDPNEVASTLAAFRSNPDGPLFFHYLDTVVSDGRAVVRSGRTLDYYRSIRDVCYKHLKPYEEEPEQMAQVLGWVVRLMRYYKVADRLEQPPSRGALAVPLVERESGQVKWFNADKGFGFIQRDGGDKDLFFHHSQLPAGFKAPPLGTKVTFVVGQGPKGPRAEDIQPI